LHSWTDPIERITAEASSKNVTIATPIIGEGVTIGVQTPILEWWKQNN
jgi:hypothetical protein